MGRACLSVVAFFSLLGLLALPGCGGKPRTDSPDDALGEGVQAAYEPRYAERFRVDHVGEHLLLTVWPPWRDPAVAGSGLRYLLATREGDGAGPEPAPRSALELGSAERVVDVPVRRLITTSTTEVAHLDLLDAVESLFGHSELDYVSSQSVRGRIEDGKVVEVGGGSGLHPELVLDVEPDVVLADFLAQSELDALAQVEAAGVPVVLMPSFLETSPLGRAEWIVVTGLLVGRFYEAKETFGRVESGYLDLRRRVSEHVESLGPGARQPTVVTGGPWDDVWHVPGGNSYAARFLADAGARYLWADDESTGALPLDLETVYDQAIDADCWLYPSSWRSLDEIRRADSRLADFRAFREGRVWANDRRLNARGGNDFWESGSSRPDRILEDLVRIFHPELAAELPTKPTESELVYHRRLATSAPETAPETAP